MAKIQKILIANRGEIAVRVIRTAKKLGIKTVAVYSDADKDSLYTKLADESIYIGKAEPKFSYLNQETILRAIKETKADAVHPGYGFLSENADFAEALHKIGVTFIGPSPESIRAMGDKIGSRLLVAKHSVPVVPGYEGEDQSIERFQTEARRIGFPLMAKASAGGGGKGMRRINSESELEAGIVSAKREALSSFGDDRLLLEKYILNPRHVEFQIFGDGNGNVIHLHERDCSMQRRHQKVVEETPAPNFPKDLKAKMASAAIQAAKSVNYRGAGTVEFILGEKGEFYFLEMNTRLQVEHPVTEMTTGLDLVELQIRIAEGGSLPETPEQKGHSIEVRIYAEDPKQGFLPSIGKIHALQFPEGEGIRIDAGVQTGSEISIYYDPMIAKLICYAETRDLAIEKTLDALKRCIVFGPTTNLTFLQSLVGLTEFRSGHFSTHTIAEKDTILQREKLDPKFQLAYAGMVASIKSTVDPWNQEVIS
ncbi:acetyl/propionyl-CoA carboxylase subunit alpha [Leptospira ryugenii]|uniref:Acetyl/propionyl-CoA carboxylase subunit alpha n=1 Tax=Leptospira ryugenii TaxID=1917863 RepID=A0A2P2E025_9LEPT|nr:biotin carboxylase N-terminal domain-containing protein [Leptospira ryugenii]GBF50223.1 acetyl/propionyl-CoA carboxylase subunit alpha [Leptospira ryugenii]